MSKQILCHLYLTQNPQEPEPWNEPFYATDLGDACIQLNVSFVQLTHRGWERYSEDCLHLNIYVPEVIKYKLSALVESDETSPNKVCRPIVSHNNI